MPNLDYDPQYPVTDLLGNPIAEGDYVAWGTNYGRSAALCIARIDQIKFFREQPGGYKNEWCDQDDAEGYRLYLEPIKTTGSESFVYADDGQPIKYDDRVTRRTRVNGRGWNDPIEDSLARPVMKSGRAVKSRVKWIIHVKNVVKLDPDMIQHWIDKADRERVR